MEEDDNIVIDEPMQGINKQDEDIDMNEGMVNQEFVFSGLRDAYFHSIKNLIRSMFEYDDVNLSYLADLILSMKEDCGTAIKTEDEDETKNKDIEIFGIFSLVPLTFFSKGNFENNTKVSQQIITCLKSKIDQYGSNLNDKATATDILMNSKLGLLVNERAINMPQAAIPVTLQFILNELSECREEETYDKRYEVEYLVIISKFAKKLNVDHGKRVKKIKSDNNTNEEVLHYKFETEMFMQNAVVNVNYKIPYEQMNMEYLENKNEPQYYNIAFIKASNFLKIVNNLNK